MVAWKVAHTLALENKKRKCKVCFFWQDKGMGRIFWPMCRSFGLPNPNAIDPFNRLTWTIDHDLDSPCYPASCLFVPFHYLVSISNQSRIIFITFICYLLMYFVFSKIAKRTKQRKSGTTDNHCSKLYFRYELVNARNRILASMLRFKSFHF